MLPCNEDGSYLVRETESNDNGYSLSVRNGVTVSHYHIRQINALGFYIATSRRLFKDVADLVAHYQADADGLCSNLRKPCVASMPPSKDDIRKSRGLSDQWEIAHDSLQWCHRIYEGDITDVFKCVLNKSTPVTVKILKENSLLSKEEFLEEIQIMKRVQHVNIIKVCGASTIKEPICIVYEHMKGGPLVSYLHGNNLESIRCIHRDLAARNILVGQNNIVKIAGFSLSQIVSEEIYKSPVSNIMCAVKWSAPEVLFQMKFSVKSDVWSFGIVLVELVKHGGSPYPEMDQEEVKTRLAEGYRMPQMDGCPDRLYQIMLMCWKEEDMERPTFKIIKEQLEEIASSLFGITEC
jgi:fyn-related kinase